MILFDAKHSVRSTW